MLLKRQIFLSGAALAVGREALAKAIEAHRTADCEALRDVTLHLDEDVENLPVLDTFRDDLASKRVSEADRGLDHYAVAAIVDDTFYEALVDLDLVGRDLLQIVEGGEARAVIVNGDVHPEIAQPGDHVEGITAGQCGSFRELEGQAFRREPVPREHCRQAKRESLVGE